MSRKLLHLGIALLCMTCNAMGQTFDPLRGDWALQVEGRNLMVLHLEGEAQSLTGTLQRPMGLSLGPFTALGARVSQVKLPQFTVAVKETRTTPSGRAFSLRQSSVEAGEIVLRLDGQGNPELALGADAPATAFVPLSRLGGVGQIDADWNPERTYLIRAPALPPNPKLASLFEADQADRRSDRNVDWAVVGPRDAERRQRVRALLDEGSIRAADDYYRAAFVFQHGNGADDHLLAHVLAMAAMALGRADASWIATATLDRYLQNSDRPQIFGTQFVGARGTPMTQGQYDPALIPDSVRQLLGVPTIEQQARQLEQLKQR
jgi:hypothetical protein